MSDEKKSILRKAAPIVNQRVGGDFSRVESPERKQALLRATPHAKQPSLLWTKDRKLKRYFFVRRWVEYIGYFECEFVDRASKVLGELDQELDIAGGNDIYFNIRCEESSLFFHLKRKSISSRGGLLRVDIPRELFEVQRRSQLRYRTDPDDQLLLTSNTLGSWPTGISVLDLSSGGVGIQIEAPPAEIESRLKLNEGMRFESTLDLGVLTFTSEVEVRYLKRIPGSMKSGVETARIGLRFVALSQETVEALQIFVMEKSYDRLVDMFGED